MSSGPPVARRTLHRRELHGEVVEDPYHWLRDPGYPDVTDPDILAHLEAENRWFDTWFEPHRACVDELFQELKAREPREDESVPHKRRGWLYRWRFECDAEYRLWERAPIDTPDAWRTILAEPELAHGHDYFRLGALAVSPDARLLAWSTDTDGSERYTLKLTDLETGAALPLEIADTLGSPVWSPDGSGFFYTVVNDRWRPWQVRRHVLGQDPSLDRVVYEEADEAFFVGVDDTQSERWVVISSGDHVTSELHILPADQPDATPQLISPRRARHEYDLDHRGDVFFIRTNRRHCNFDIVTAPVDDPREQNWQPFIEGSDDLYVTGHVCFADHVIVAAAVRGLDHIEVCRAPDADEAGVQAGRRTDSGDANVAVLAPGWSAHTIAFPEQACSVDFGTNPEFECTKLRLGYTSMVTPVTVYDYDLATRRLESLKVQEVPGGYDRDAFETHRIEVPARDGSRVPVSLVCRNGFPRDGSGPLYLYGYGAYGVAIAPSFSAARLSLLERGFAFAIAHVRGGDDLGYGWYEAGKLERRTNTFNDFVDVARHLIARGWTGMGRIAAVGGSAGGELVAAVANQAPALWGAVVAHVPFVDVLNTMCDTSLPLTPIEWPEWGNPLEDPAAFRLIRSYAPYEQLRAQAYPPMLVTAGLNDPRVTYWEAAKYVARLRNVATGSAQVILKTNMGAGHGGRSGRYDSLLEVAEEYAFLIATLGGGGQV
jgi:oligopeptidase B